MLLNQKNIPGLSKT